MESKYNIPNSRAIGIRVLTETLALLFLVYPMIHIYVFLQGKLNEPDKFQMVNILI